MTNYPVDSAPAASGEAFEIDLINKWTGTFYPRVPVFGANTMAQILEEYAKDLGIYPQAYKIFFENLCIGLSTSDRDETVEGLELQEGDVLAITAY